jgi:hypothetical protein
VNLQSDLFSINNIFVPTRNKIVSSSPVQKNQINSNCVILEQKSFETFDVISINPKKIDYIEDKEQRKLEKIFNKNKSDRKYRKGESYKNLKINKWHSFVFDRMKASIRSRNNAFKRVYKKSLQKHEIVISNGFHSEEPVMRILYTLPNFKKDFILKLWDIQNGLDAYTNKPMFISDKINSFSPSCDRIYSNVNYEIGNVVLCCYSTNLGKHEFDPFLDEENSWMDYISDNDPIKKQEIRERIKRIQTLSME